MSIIMRLQCASLILSTFYKNCVTSYRRFCNVALDSLQMDVTKEIFGIRIINVFATQRRGYLRVGQFGGREGSDHRVKGFLVVSLYYRPIRQ